MAIPLLDYSPSSQNQRVVGFEISGDEQPKIYSTDNLLVGTDMDGLIKAAYRQIFNEQQILTSNRQKTLESQLKYGQITARDFIRGLTLSDTFRKYIYETNNNYRFVQICVQRLLGRNVYSEREKIAWSIILATKGLKEFIDILLSSDEYMMNFGYHIVPYQRRRILPQRYQGDLPFARMPRYGEDYRKKLEQMGYFKPLQPQYRWEWQKPPYPKVVRTIGAVITITGAAILSLGAIAVILAAFDIISL